MVGFTTPLANWVIVLPLLLCLGGAAALLMLRSFIRVQMWVCLAVVGLVFA